MMAPRHDDRIPVRFASPAQAGAGEALLVEDGVVQPVVSADCAIIRFRSAGAAHLPGCTCCAGRGAAATALGELFQARALGRVAWFTGVVAVVADPVAVAGELQSDRLAAARFRVQR